MQLPPPSFLKENITVLNENRGVTKKAQAYNPKTTQGINKSLQSSLKRSTVTKPITQVFKITSPSQKTKEYNLQLLDEQLDSNLGRVASNDEEVEKWKKFGYLMAESYDDLKTENEKIKQERDMDRKIVLALKEQIDKLKLINSASGYDQRSSSTLDQLREDNVRLMQN